MCVCHKQYFVHDIYMQQKHVHDNKCNPHWKLDFATSIIGPTDKAPCVYNVIASKIQAKNIHT